MPTIWLSPTDYVTSDRSLRIKPPSESEASAVVTSKTVGNSKWLSLSLRLPENAALEELTICYQLSHARSFIAQTRLAEMGLPGQTVVRYDDPTDLRSTTPARTSKAVGGIATAPGAAMTLQLRLSFKNKTDAILLGAVGVRFSLQGAVSTSVHVQDYGAKGDGVTDDGPAIQAAIADAQTQKKPLCFDAKVYLVKQELAIANTQLVMRGTNYVGGQMTTLKAGVAMRSVLALAHQVHLQDLVLDANRRATYAMYLQGCSLSNFDRVHAAGALKDGVYLSNVGDNGKYVINDTNRWEDFHTGGNGTLYITPDLESEYIFGATPSVEAFVTANQRVTVAGGSVATTSGSNIITGTNTQFQTWGVRRGDPIRIGARAAKQYYVIGDVMSESQLTVLKQAEATALNQPFAIGSGDGYHEVRHGDNNCNQFTGGFMRSNVGYAYAFDGLYGPTVIGPQIDYHPFWAMRFGVSGADPVIAAVIIKPYFEAIGRKPFLVNCALNLGVYNPVDTGYESDPIDYGGHPGNVRGLYVNDTGVLPIGTPSGYSNKLVSKTLWDCTSHRGLFFNGQELIPGETYDPTQPLLPHSTFVFINPNGVDVTLTGRPAIANQGGKLLVLINKGPNNTITLQNDGADERNGTGVRLSTDQVMLKPYDSIMLYNDGWRWIEISRTALAP